MNRSAEVSGAAVCAVVCCYTDDRWRDVLDAVEGLLDQSEPPGTILIVVDHNLALHDRLVQHFDGATSVHITANSGPRGLSGARNTAITGNDKDFIAFLDDDARPDPHWLAELLGPFRRSPAVYVTGGRSMPGWPGFRPSWFPEEFDWVVGSTYRGMPETEAVVRNVHGCSMLFRRAVFTEVGGFVDGVGRLDTVPLGGEETELCIRLKAAKPAVEIRYVPTSLVIHRVSPARTRFAYFVRRCYAEGISKAQIARLVGAQSATSDERSYVTKALVPALVGSLGLGSAGSGRHVRPGRAGAIVAGLAVTAAGYLRGRLGRAPRAR